jgi:hypothetical protein
MEPIFEDAAVGCWTKGSVMCYLQKKKKRDPMEILRFICEIS